jgi:hypothetical protein
MMAGANNSMMNQTRNTNNLKILSNLQNQDYFLQKALRHFKAFKVSQVHDKVILMMFTHVKNELIRYKLLSKYDNQHS